LTFIPLHWLRNSITAVILILRVAGELVNDEETNNILENDIAIFVGCQAVRYSFDFYKLHATTLINYNKNIDVRTQSATHF